MFFKRLYIKFARFTEGRKLETLSDFVLLVASSYLLAKRIFDVSISDWLSTNVFQSTNITNALVTFYLYTVAILLVCAVIFKAACLIVKAFPVYTYAAAEPEKIASCIKVINNEISDHIDRCDSTHPIEIGHLDEEHKFDVNICSIV